MVSKKVKRAHNKRERHSAHIPTTLSATLLRGYCVVNFLTARANTTQRERERFFEKIRERERCRIVPHYPFVIVIVKATPRTPHHHRWSFEIEAEEDEKERSW